MFQKREAFLEKILGKKRVNFRKGLVKKEKALFMSFLIICSIFVFGFNAEDAEAQRKTSTQQKACCQLTKNKESCVYTDRNQCDTSNGLKVSNTVCEEATYCQNVCCVDSVEGCMVNVPSGICSSKKNAQSFNDASCKSVNECSSGCCVLGSKFKFTSEKECKSLANSVLGQDYNFEDVFKQASTEQECLSLSLQNEEGCCVQDNSCKFSKKSECSGNFNLNDKCSSIKECKNICKPKSKKDCFDGSVYFFDSCGNREELSEECNYEDGNLCANEDGKAFCKSLDCSLTTKYEGLDYTGISRKHGESWCVYEGPTGNFLDRPGSTHYRFKCLNGEESVDECTEGRRQVCVQANFNNSGFSQSACVNNNIYKSVLTTNESTVPVGFKFWENNQESKDQCKKGTTRCTVYYVKKNRVSDFECKGNCFCESQEFIDQANTYCKSFGDCGFSYNVLGEEGSSGLNIYWTGTNLGPRINTLSEAYKNSLKQFGIYGGMSFLDSEVEKIIAGFDAKTDKKFAKQILIFGTVGYLTMGVVSTILLTTFGGLTLAGGPLSFGAFVSVLSGGFSAGILEYDLALTKISEPAVSQGYVSEALSRVARLGADIGNAISRLFSGTSQATTAGSTSATTGGTTSSTGATTTGATVAATPIAIIGAVLVVIVIITTAVLAIVKSGGAVKEKTINIECKPWQAPLGGNSCEKCDDDSNIPCNEYRCRSLGIGCRLVNEATENPKCVDVNPNDPNSPKLSPKSLSKYGYSISEEKLGYRINEQIKPLEKFTFGVITDEEAVCNYDFKHDIKYSDMLYDFGNDDFKKEHNLTLLLEGDKEYKFYTRCVDAVGNENSAAYLISFKTKKEPDLQAPIIVETSLKNNALIPANLDFALVELELNEPATCRHDLKSNKKYEEMSSQGICNNEFSLVPEKYTCKHSFINLKKGINTFFFLCKDLANNENKPIGYPFSVVRTEPLNLTIDEISPRDTIRENNIILSVSTINGAENGKSICKYSQKDLSYENMIEFSKTNSNQHTQDQTNLKNGNYDYFIKCRDKAGNEDKKKISFKVFKEIIGSGLVYAYKDSYNLNVVYNVASTCEYDNKPFSYGSGKKMEGEKVTEHTAPLEFKEYYIQCVDENDKTISGARISI